MATHNGAARDRAHEAQFAVIVRTPRGTVQGYGLTRQWEEAGGVNIYLLDVWAAPGPDRQRVEAELFDHLEASIRALDQTVGAVVLGANGRSSEPSRRRLLVARGYRLVFDMIELEAPRTRPARGSMPAGVTVRTVTRNDAAAIHGLTLRVWSGRPYFTMPTLHEVDEWLARADPELFLLAEVGAHLVALASGNVSSRCAEIDDVQVDPTWRRQGLATALLAELMPRLEERTTLPIRLHTEGHDPAGARTLYARLGFNVVAAHYRFRKPLDDQVRQGRPRRGS